MAAAMAAQCGKKVLLVLNKGDLSTPQQRQRTRAFYEEKLPQVETLEMTALSPESAGKLIQRLKELLPMDLLLYDRDEVTTAYERDIAAELIREAVLELLREEIPHAIAVTLDSWTSTDRGPVLEATLILEREAHKGIVIGQGGRMIKAIRHHASKKISEMCQGAKVELSLRVRVVPNWRKHKQFLKNIRLWES